MISRIITKVFSIVEDFKWKNYYDTCLRKGLQLGKEVVLHNGINFGSEPYLVQIGDCSRIGEGCLFINHSGGQMLMRKVKAFEDIRIFGRIKIGNDTFIGARVIIHQRVSIGNNCIVGAGSIVNSSIPDNCVFAGVPAVYISTTEEYYEKKKLENSEYPRELEKDRKKLDSFIKEKLPHSYKPNKKNIKIYKSPRKDQENITD